jgi:hypothetical protein
MKSSTAAPSFRNSGLEQTWTGWDVSASMASRTRAAVPTGTVLFVMTMRSPSMAFPMERATESTCWRSADPSSPGGVPTAMKRMRDFRTASATSVVKTRRPASRFS